MPSITSNTRLILGIVSAASGIIAGLIGNVLSINFVYFFTRKGRPPTQRPIYIWISFYLSATVSIFLGSFAAFAPISPVEINISPFETPTSALINSLTYTYTPSPTETPMATLLNPTETPISLATIVPTYTPTIVPTQTIPPLVERDCFDENIWTPYEYIGSSVFINDDGCWNLNYWGFTARNNGMIITPPISPTGIGHGIYTPIPNVASIKLSILVKEFNIHEVNSANIGIGVVDNKNPGLSHSRVIYYHYIPEASTDHIAIKTGEDADYKDLLTSTLAIGDTQEIFMQLDGPLLKIIINEEEVEMTVLFEQRAFWISYSVPDMGELVAIISNLEIK